MTEYIHSVTGEIKTERQILDPIRATTSISKNTIAELGYVPVLQAPAPTPSSPVKVVRRNGVTTDSLGNKVQAWTEVDMFADYTDEQGVVHTKAEQEAEYLANKQAAEDAAALEASKMTGIDILGVMCSATKTDQSGLSAVALGVTLARMANSTFPDTKFEFENGNSLVVTNANFDTIYAAWMPFRQSFFTP